MPPCYPTGGIAIMAAPMEPKTLIPTVGRAKLRRGQSYPVGAEVITNCLVGVPQFRQLSISFEREAVMAGDFSVIYDSHDSSWRIVVRSVRSDRRAGLRQALTSIGLPAARAWLLTHRPDIWYVRDHQFSVKCWGEKPNVSLDEFEKPSNERHWPIVPVKRTAL